MRIVAIFSTVLLCSCDAQTTTQFANVLSGAVNQHYSNRNNSDQYLSNPTYYPQPQYANNPPQNWGGQQPAADSGPIAYREVDPPESVNRSVNVGDPVLCYKAASVGSEKPTPGTSEGGTCQ